MSARAADLSRLRVWTPENVDFDFEIANLASRFYAWFIDQCVIAGVLFLLGCIVSIVAGLSGMGQGLTPVVFVALLFLVPPLYFTLLERWTRGRSLGKKALRLRVIQETGVPLALGPSILRNLFRVVDMMPGVGGIGAAAVFLTRRGQRLGDLAAGTVVIREERRVAPKAARTRGEWLSGEFLADPTFRWRILAAVAPDERDLVVQLCLRRHSLDMDSRARLLSGTRELLEMKLGASVPPYLSDERFVAGVGSILVEGSSIWPGRNSP